MKLADPAGSPPVMKLADGGGSRAAMKLADASGAGRHELAALAVAALMCGIQVSNT